MHAAAIAAELGIERLLCPRAGGVLSALGLCASDRRRDTTRTVMLSGPDLTAARIAAEVEDLIAGLGEIDNANPEVVYEMRYAGQAFELPVPGSTCPDPVDLAERFAAAHEERYGHRDPDGEVVLVHIRLALVARGAQPQLAAGTGHLDESARDVRFDGEWQSTSVLRGEPPAAFTATGPAIFELPEATFVLPPGWQAEVDDTGTIHAQTTNHPGATL
jgi:N-methylhydantoinase A